MDNMDKSINSINIYKTGECKLTTVFNKQFTVSMETSSVHDTVEILKMLSNEETTVYIHYKECVKLMTLRYADTLGTWLMDLLYSTEEE